MDCGGVFVKYVLFIFNIIFVVCGILIITAGSMIIAQMGDFHSFQKTWEINSGPILLIILGSIIFLVAFMGCCGAIRENSCCTLTYSIVMLILFVCQMVLIIYVWTQRSHITTSIQDMVKDIWDQHKTNPALMDSLQIGFKCCGYKYPSDYATSFESVPNSCCGPAATSCSLLDLTNVPGCSYAAINFWEHNLDFIRFAGLGLAAVELVAFIFGFCLYNGIRNNGRRTNY